MEADEGSGGTQLGAQPGVDELCQLREYLVEHRGRVVNAMADALMERIPSYRRFRIELALDVVVRKFTARLAGAADSANSLADEGLRHEAASLALTGWSYREFFEMYQLVAGAGWDFLLADSGICLAPAQIEYAAQVRDSLKVALFERSISAFREGWWRLGADPARLLDLALIGDAAPPEQFPKLHQTWMLGRVANVSGPERGRHLGVSDELAGFRAVACPQARVFAVPIYDPDQVGVVRETLSKLAEQLPPNELIVLFGECAGLAKLRAAAVLLGLLEVVPELPGGPRLLDSADLTLTAAVAAFVPFVRAQLVRNALGKLLNFPDRTRENLFATVLAYSKSRTDEQAARLCGVPKATLRARRARFEAISGLDMSVAGPRMRATIGVIGYYIDRLAIDPTAAPVPRPSRGHAGLPLGQQP